MASIDDVFGIHAAALTLRGQRMELLASNIANAATPNFKARDMEFSQALAGATAGKEPSSAVRFRVPLQPSIDGNTVELATEQTAFAENAIAYRTSLSFLNARASSVMQALRGE